VGGDAPAAQRAPPLQPAPAARRAPPLQLAPAALAPHRWFCP